MSGIAWITWQTLHSYSSKHCGFRELAVFPQAKSENGFISLVSSRRLSKSNLAASHIIKKMGSFDTVKFVQSDLSVFFLSHHISALVISVVLWCCDSNLFISQPSHDTYHKLKIDWSRFHPTAQLSFDCPLKQEEKSSDSLCEVMKLWNAVKWCLKLTRWCDDTAELSTWWRGTTASHLTHSHKLLVLCSFSLSYWSLALATE